MSLAGKVYYRCRKTQRKFGNWPIQNKTAKQAIFQDYLNTNKMFINNEKLMEVECCLHDVMCCRQIIMKRYSFFPLFPSFSPSLLLHPIIYFCTAWIPSQIPGLYIWMLFLSHNSSSHLLTEKHFILFNQFPPQTGLLLK